MRCATRWQCAALCAVWFLAALSAQAETKIYMRIEGNHPFPGEGTKPGSPWIVVLQVDYSVTKAGAGATGRRSAGPGLHSPVQVIKRLGASSPKLAEAVASGEHLKKVVLEWVRVNNQGDEQVYLTTTLEDVIVTNDRKKADVHDHNPEPLEEISFEYAKINRQYTQLPPDNPNQRVWEKPR